MSLFPKFMSISEKNNKSKIALADSGLNLETSDSLLSSVLNDDKTPTERIEQRSFSVSILLASALAVFYPLYYFLHKTLNPNIIDNLPIRIIVSSSIFVIILLSSRINILKKNYRYIFPAIAYLMSFKVLYLAYINGFSPDYTIGYMLIFVGSSLLFKTITSLAVYNIFTTTVFIGVSLISNGIQNMAYSVSILVWCIVSYIVYNQKLTMEKETITGWEVVESIVNQSYDAVMVVEPLSMKIVYCNPASLILFDAEKFEELLGKSSSEIKIPDFVQIDSSAMLSYEDNMNVWSGEVELVSKRGRKFWADVVARFIKIKDKPYFLLRILDITKRIQAEIERNEAEAKYKSLVEESMVGVYVIQDEVLVYANPKMAEIFGYSEKEINSKLSIKNFILPEDWKFVQRNIDRRFNDENTSIKYSFRGIKKDGSIIYLEVHSARINYNGKPAIIGSLLDVTETKLKEAHLRMQTSAINATTDEVVITDPDGIIEYVNPAFERETGYTSAEVVGKNSNILGSGRQPVSFYEDLWSTITSGKTWTGEVVNRRKNGTTVVEDMTITPVINDKGEIEHFVAIKRNITEKKAYQEQLDRLAYHDPLTGLPNRLLFSDRLTSRITEAKRRKECIGVMFLDLDKFKEINDTMGHNVGDSLLMETSSRLTKHLRDVDTISRMGGDEFTVILSGITHPDDAVNVANRVLEVLKKPFFLEGHEISITTSIGISLYPQDGEDVETLVKNADIAMYKAKEAGRNTFRLYNEEMNTSAMERITIENDLRRAVERENFILYYQPRVDITTGAILGAEALVRWKHEELGLLNPQSFMSVAEETGLILKIGEWVTRAACQQNKAWQDKGLPKIAVSVNLSLKEFHQPQLLSILEECISSYKLDPYCLNIEISEQTLLADSLRSIDILQKISNLNINVLIDNFGVGVSSLGHLTKLPVSAVKIDRRLIKDILENEQHASMAEAVIAMAHSLNLKVIAEGVETIEQLKYLKTIKCDEMQGYFVSPPVSSDDFESMLKDKNKKKRFSSAA
ncbi:MAG: EAL domain-containing protein [Armatimonadota bacterium]